MAKIALIGVDPDFSEILILEITNRATMGVTIERFEKLTDAMQHTGFNLVVVGADQSLATSKDLAVLPHDRRSTRDWLHWISGQGTSGGSIIIGLADCIVTAKAITPASERGMNLLLPNNLLAIQKIADFLFSGQIEIAIFEPILKGER